MAIFPNVNEVNLLKREEEKIRDYLSENLGFIDNSLKLIKKEFKLENEYGSRGFIDILAKDNYNNFVVIEIKKSNQAARQAIHEIMKYVALLKHNYKTKDSEIRVLIISTKWEELLIPFSELILQAPYFIEGYKIDVDINYIPIIKTKIVPVENPYPRNFSRYHIGFFCEDHVILEQLTTTIQIVMSRRDIDNYILIEMETNSPKYPNPHAIYLVMVSYLKERYWEILNSLDENDEESVSVEEIREYIENSEDMIDDSELYYLETGVLSQIVSDILRSHSSKGYFIENGSPEGFSSSLENWNITRIHKFGFIKEDLRLEDEYIKKEVMGLKGRSRHLFHDFCETKHKAKLKEIKDSLKYCLFFNKIWGEDIENIFSKYENENVLISLFIYNPPNILEILYTAIHTQGGTLPYYEMVVDFIDSDIPFTIIYSGGICWDGDQGDFREIVNKFFYKDEFNILMHMTMHSIEEMNASIMQELGLRYITQQVKIDNNKIKEQSQFGSSKIGKGISEFYCQNQGFVADLISFFDRYTNLADNYKK